MGFLTRLLAGLLAASTLGTGLAGTANAVDAAGAASDTTGAVTTTADDTGGRTVLDCRQSGEGFYNGICHTYNGKIVPRF